jgi:exodeoxyribonuclease VII small subunit
MAKKTRSRGKKDDAPDTKAPASGDDGQGQGSVEEVLGRLESVVSELESGDLPLETALLRFEEGVKLARQGNGLLDAVEQRVEVLLADREEPVPFAGEDEVEDD